MAEPKRVRRAMGAACAAAIIETRPVGRLDAAAKRERAAIGSISCECTTAARRRNAAASGSDGTGDSACRIGITAADSAARTCTSDGETTRRALGAVAPETDGVDAINPIDAVDAIGAIGAIDAAGTIGAPMRPAVDETSAERAGVENIGEPEGRPTSVLRLARWTASESERSAGGDPADLSDCVEAAAVRCRSTVDTIGAANVGPVATMLGRRQRGDIVVSARRTIPARDTTAAAGAAPSTLARSRCEGAAGPNSETGKSPAVVAVNDH
jgi:hypothetical protein